MEERVYITEEFKQELINLGCTAVDYIYVYKIEGDKVFFKADQCKLHLSKQEMDDATLKQIVIL